MSGNIEFRKAMKLHLVCKRHYTNKDLLQDRFGRLYHLPVQLFKLGLEIQVTAIDYRHSISEQREIEGVSFRTLPIAPSRLVSALDKLQKDFRANPPDIILASGDSHIGFLGLRIARSLGVPFVFDIYDYYPAFAGNRIPGMKTLFRKAVRGADLVLCASTPLLERLSPLKNTRLLVENGVDRQLFSPMEQDKARSKYGLGKEIPLVGYFGSIQPNRGPLLIEACRYLRSEWSHLTLLIAGSRSRISISEPWIRYLGQVPQKIVPELIAACDLVTIPYNTDKFNDMSGACKIAEYLSCRKPVVATNIAGHHGFFRASSQSLCEPNPLDMAEAIHRQLNQPQVEPFPERLEWETIAKTLYTALNDLTKIKPAS